MGERTIGILQPGYLPWLGFFEQMHKSDVFVIYDDVQYDKEGWRNRNRIKTANGIQWLTVPVMVNLEAHPLVHEVKIDNKTNWRKKHLSSIRQNYSKAPYFKKYIDIFEEGYSKEWECLVDIDMYFILRLSECLGMDDTKIIKSSALNIDGDKIGRLINICKFFNADTFYEGAAGKNYIDENYFESHGIKMEYQDYKHPIYNQLYGDFVPYLSVIDLLFNHGDESLAILLNKNL
ncbi:MAG: WbqC family protein [Deltaproteobacteria bacterium]|nr:WbqC family protein [Deltaproteobacteria bacterium]